VKKKIRVELEIDCEGDKCGRCEYRYIEYRYIVEGVCYAPTFRYPMLKRVDGDFERCDDCKAAEVKG
jgi:hypothetical protein